MLSDHIRFEWLSKVDKPTRLRGSGRRREDEAVNDCYIDDIDIYLDLRTESSSVRDINSRTYMDGRVHDESIGMPFKDGELYHTSTLAAMSQDRLVKYKHCQYNWHRSHYDHSRDTT